MSVLQGMPSWPRVQAARAEIQKLVRLGDQKAITAMQAELDAAFTACRDELTAAASTLAAPILPPIAAPEGREAGSSEGMVALEPAPEPERRRRSPIASDEEKTPVDRPVKASGAKKLGKGKKRRT
jgi:hypothetical protein